MKNFNYEEIGVLEEYREIFERYSIHIDVDSLNTIKEKAKHKDYVVSIIGSMKAGKSTFVNSILGDDLMPSENAACTLTTTEIVHSEEIFSLEKIYDDGKVEEISTGNISEDFHNEIRNSRESKEKKSFKYSLKTSIEGIRDDLCDIGFKLVDTPGYNEMSGLGVDRRIIEEVFEKQIKRTDYVIYVLDYKYYKAEENIEILEKIKLFRKDIFENDNIVFILNKIDLITYKDGDIASIVEEVQTLLNTVGVKNPAILPFSAKKAFLYEALKKGENIDRYVGELDDFNEPVEQIIDGQAYMVKLPIERLKENFYNESNIGVFKERVLRELFNKREELLIESLNGQKNTVIEKFLKNSKEDLEELVNNFLEKKNKASEEKEKTEELLELKNKVTELLDKCRKIFKTEKKEDFRKRYYYKCDYVKSNYSYQYGDRDEYYSSSYSAEQNGKVRFKNWKQTIEPNFLSIYNYYKGILSGDSYKELKKEALEVLNSAESMKIDVESFIGKSIYIETNIGIKPKEIMNLSYDNSESYLEDGYDNSTFVDYDDTERYVEGFFGEKLKTVYVYDITKAVKEEEKDIMNAQNVCSGLFFNDFHKKYSEYKKDLKEIVCTEIEKLKNALDGVEIIDDKKEEVKSDDEENIVIMGTIFNELEAYLGEEV